VYNQVSQGAITSRLIAIGATVAVTTARVIRGVTNPPDGTIASEAATTSMIAAAALLEVAGDLPMTEGAAATGIVLMVGAI